MRRVYDVSRAEAFLYLMIGGLFMLVTSAFFLRDSVRLMRRGEHGIGTIIAVQQHRGRRGRSGARRATVRLTGSRISGQCVIRARRDDVVGRTLPMVFLPESPDICRIDRLPQLVGAPGLAFGVASILVLGTLALYEQERRRASRRGR